LNEKAKELDEARHDYESTLKMKEEEVMRLRHEVASVRGDWREEERR